MPSTTTSATADFEASSSSQYDEQARAHNNKQDKLMGLPDLQHPDESHSTRAVGTA
ncbi:hypothetical protein [Legionella shakespearei]|nr:hypothetical protein [Legionella shakespearei]